MIDYVNLKTKSVRRRERMTTVAKYVATYAATFVFCILFLIVATSDKVWGV